MNARNRALLAISLAVMAVAGLSAWTVYYKEQYYKLWHEHYIQYPDDIIENIVWLERAKEAPFCNPLYALAKIENKKQWERYRYLLDMHLDLKLIEAHLALGSKYDKRVAYFFNAPWKDQNLESLKIAESAYKTALAWWPEAKELAAKAMAMQFVDVEGAEFMADEAFRITTGDLDFGKTIQRELDRVAKVRADFEKMDASTY
ncbi:MAG TPA: hypothetical protein VMV83_06460 [Rectinemataceae bacterium]|nr:hypothetical protein [Rectinemataceae bacterium]